MFFDDEKDIKDSTELEIGDANSSDWKDLLDNDEDLVSLKEDAKSSFDKSNDGDFSSDIEYIDDVDDIDDAELERILNDDSSVLDENGNLKNDSVKASEPEIQSSDEEIKTPGPKMVQNSNSTLMIVLVAILFVIFLVGGVKFFLNYTETKNLNNLELNTQETPLSEMDSATKEDISARNEEEKDTSIPVVNDENISDITADKQDEKKEVINIIPTGRSNPFMPIDKYNQDVQNVKLAKYDTKIINNIDYDSISIPKPPKHYGENSEITSKLMSIVVSGIMYEDQKPSAIITYQGNDYFVQKGDQLDKFRVVDIGKTFVKIQLGKNIYKASIGEEFKVTEIYGSSVDMSGKNGRRQYFSSEEEYNTSRLEGREYTSVNDVKIYTK